MLQRKIQTDQNFAVEAPARAGNSEEEVSGLAGMISQEQQKRFIKKLFKGNAANYRHLLARLEAGSNWAEAHRILEDYFQRHGLDPYHDDAVRFSDLVYRRYFPQDVYLYSVHEDFAQTDLRFLPFLQPAQ